MTPKEKSEELFRKIYILDHKIWQDTAKQCALIVVDEILNQKLIRIENPEQSGFFELKWI